MPHLLCEPVTVTGRTGTGIAKSPGSQNDPGCRCSLGIRLNSDIAPAASAAGGKGGGVTVTINGKAYGVEIKGDKAIVNGKEVSFTVKDGVENAAPATGVSGAGAEVPSPVPGTVLRVTAAVGSAVNEGDELLVLDVMKMETPVTAPCAGTVKSINVAPPQKVSTGDVLAVIG